MKNKVFDLNRRPYSVHKLICLNFDLKKMSSFQEDIITQIKCCLDISNHFVIEPRLLPCGHNACKSCIKKIGQNVTNCSHCKSILRKEEINSLASNEEAKVLIENNLKEIEEEIKQKLDKAIKLVNGMIIFKS